MALRYLWSKHSRYDSVCLGMIERLKNVERDLSNQYLVGFSPSYKTTGVFGVGDFLGKSKPNISAIWGHHDAIRVLKYAHLQMYLLFYSPIFAGLYPIRTQMLFSFALASTIQTVLKTLQRNGCRRSVTSAPRSPSFWWATKRTWETIRNCTTNLPSADWNPWIPTKAAWWQSASKLSLIWNVRPRPGKEFAKYLTLPPEHLCSKKKSRNTAAVAYCDLAFNGNKQIPRHIYILAKKLTDAWEKDSCCERRM